MPNNTLIYNDMISLIIILSVVHELSLQIDSILYKLQK